MKKVHVLACSVIAMVTLVTGCANRFMERTVNVSEVQVQQKLNEKLAIPLTFLKILNVNLANPIVTFDGASQRMHVALDANLNNALLGHPYSGKAKISGKLKFDNTQNAILFTDTKIDDLQFVGAEGKYTELIALLAAKLGSEVLKDVPLYRVKAEELTHAGIQYLPKQLVVSDKTLSITLAPK